MFFASNDTEEFQVEVHPLSYLINKEIEDNANEEDKHALARAYAQVKELKNAIKKKKPACFDANVPTAKSVWKPKAQWMDEEELELVHYLQEQGAGTGDGYNFSMKFFNGTSQHLKQKFPVQHGGEKTANSCQTKWCSLRDNFYIVCNLKHTSRFTWSDINGVGKDDSNKEWADYMAKHKGAKCFRSQGFPLFNMLTDMLPSQPKGTHVFCPGGKCTKTLAVSRSTIPSVASRSTVPSVASRSTIPSVASGLTIPPPIPATGAPSPTSPSFSIPTPSVAPLSIPATSGSPVGPSTPLSMPSYFLWSKRDSTSSLALTSVSQNKCKASALSNTESVEPMASKLSCKHVQTPSLAVTAQLEGSKAIKHLSNTINRIAQAFAMMGITITTANIHQDAITILKTYENNYSVDKLLYLAEQLMQSQSAATLFTGMGEVVQKHWLEMCLAEQATCRSV
ncbi:hypothetical protein EDC04DRAFT_2897063 [Pisolithus marmoratus]|nr:hypothetical protein EDC04DRAFT_2897063 [Pisolithus marmoratus]